MSDSDTRIKQVPDDDQRLTLLCETVSSLLQQARSRVQTAVNTSMVYTYFEIGRMIVEEEQEGKERAGYGQQVLKGLSEYLMEEFGKGFSLTNLKQMRQFYLAFAEDSIGQTLSDQFKALPFSSTGRKFFLSWSHYLKLMRIHNADERHFYEIEAARNNWSLSELNRQFDSALYERLALSGNKEEVAKLATEGQIIKDPQDAVKDPYILEFLGLPERVDYSEKELETRIIDNLQMFLLELGTGFTFVGRQVRISFDEDHYWVDLVFFNRILRSFVLFDLKIGKLKHQDLGQMQMYVNYYDRKVRLPDENPTVGIILCKDKKEAEIEMTLPEDNAQIFASRYETVLPSKEALKKLLDETHAGIEG